VRAQPPISAEALPTLDCGPNPTSGKTPSSALISDGATVPIVIRSPFESNRELSIKALIDTGSELTFINETLIRDWQLLLVDRVSLGVPGSQFWCDLFLAEFEIPALGIREFISVASKNLADRDAIVGRAQLRNCVLVYDGPQGTVQLRK
jgi:hypothetical protein